MAMSTGSNASINGINVTPMIDILLVLLIIFMVIVPITPRGENAQLPQSQKNPVTNPGAVVLEVLKGNGGELSFTINQQPVTRKGLQARLAAIFANRAERVLFVKGDDRLSFTQVADVIDAGHAAGVDHVGLMTPKVLAGQ
jgi:biopolymer transport protein TolR